MKLLLGYDSGEVEYKAPTQSIVTDNNLTVPDTGTWYQVSHDWWLPQFDFKPRQYNPEYEQMLPMPSTRMLWSTKPTDFISTHVSWQWRLFELFRYMVGPVPEDGEIEYWWVPDPRDYNGIIKVPQGTPGAFPWYPIGTLKWAYMDFIIGHRALTDNHSILEGFRDDVLKINTSNPKTWEIKGLTFTGNIVKQTEVRPDGLRSGLMAIEAFDYSQPAPSLDWILTNKPHLIWWTTEQGVEEIPPLGNPREWQVSKFPQLKLVCRKYGILPEVGTPYFAPGYNGWNTIERTDCKPLSNGDKYSVYFPNK